MTAITNIEFYPRRDMRTGLQKATDKAIAANKAAQRKAERQSLTGDQIRERMVSAIIESMTKRGAVTRSDLLAKNIPAEAISMNWNVCLATAHRLCPDLAKLAEIA